jgi:hypothetical protein
MAEWTVTKFRWTKGGGERQIVGKVTADTKREALRKAKVEHGFGSPGVARSVMVSRANSRRVRANSATLRNLAVVKITRNRDGTVGIVARRNPRVVAIRKRVPREVEFVLAEKGKEFAGPYSSKTEAEREARKYREHGYRVSVKTVRRNPQKRKARKR